MTFDISLTTEFLAGRKCHQKIIRYSMQGTCYTCSTALICSNDIFCTRKAVTARRSIHAECAKEHVLYFNIQQI
ncbi:unnamed protein product [Allacma fusca]|uniref:Uncharacterized protein n=1 Tax=Allacma fusca TaxID=39272 RepID=A0A8J2Q2M6_9HEXA|nr:unnamed protein product [Allacma fusca]